VVVFNVEKNLEKGTQKISWLKIKENTSKKTLPGGPNELLLTRCLGPVRGVSRHGSGLLEL
jgi:hypothetical protein